MNESARRAEGLSPRDDMTAPETTVVGLLSALEESVKEARAARARHPLTVGRLRELLAEYHESDIVLTADNNLLYRVKVDKRQTAAGVVVIVEKGDRHVF